ncbi:MAG: hypothetical protein DME49_12130 [Verrucomicrobia bacterium]|nr:MAG: hypothetical protein DMC62_05490 [Verrucomicrobiota bacterium]PYK37297.1 MAG: hypothetical protein DME49_12130 [Verrucomicrobiota bacterium]PYK93676.1 MAG: hypothetical protein DME36_08585 [Verrucomicrobiota bacterium]PYL59137.1 MAG: hypothetical protein DMF30_00365 [Verrucomicrobiota bacterium]
MKFNVASRGKYQAVSFNRVLRQLSKSGYCMPVKIPAVANLGRRPFRRLQSFKREAWIKHVLQKVLLTKNAAH